jgi:hypothetical protein
MPTLATCSYSGLNIRYASLTYSRGVTPSIATVLCAPQSNLRLPPSTLAFSFGNNSVAFQDAAILSAYVRRRYMGKGWLHSVQIADRRWKWAFGSISGEYNKRKPDGTVDENTRKTPAELADLCLQAMGEGSFNTGQMPQGVFPYVKWSNENPALALASLCDYVACDVVLNYQTNGVEIWPLGTGQGTLTGFGEEHPKFNYRSANVPSTIEAHGGDSRFQNKLRLRAVATNESGVQDTLANTFNTVTLNQQALHFPGLSTNQHIALDQAWKEYRVTGQVDSSLAVPQCQESITSTDQYLLDDYIIDPVESDLADYSRNLPSYVEGDFWAYADTPTSLSDKRCLMPSRLNTDRRIVKFDFPVIKLGTTGLIEEPTLYLTTSYRVRAQDGTVVHVFTGGNVGGSGGKLVLRRPEVFASYQSTYNGASQAGTSNTQSTAMEELNRYVQIFQQKFSNSDASELTYPGIIPGLLNGNVCQIRWECGVNRQAKTMACEVEELDVTATPRTERRRREILRQIAEAMA